MSGPPLQATSYALEAAWQAALAEAWEAYLQGSYPIGACVADAEGNVLARGRNRLGEARKVEGGVISGHDLAHAEINALLNLPTCEHPECQSWTVISTVEPCPQCAGAIAMSGIRAVSYAASDPWAGCTRLLTDDPYVSRKRMRVSRAPENVQKVALRMFSVGLLESGAVLDQPPFTAFSANQDDLMFALSIKESGRLLALKERRASLAEALELLMGPTPTGPA